MPNDAATSSTVSPVASPTVSRSPNSQETPSPTPPTASKATGQTLLWQRSWTPTLLSFAVTRDPDFRFTPGHYTRIGLPAASGETVFRPLSIVSAPVEPQLEFLCTLVADGDFSSRLAACRVGDPVEVDRLTYGFLLVDSLAPGSDLWLLASGSGLGPYVSMLRDAAVWTAFERIVVVHSVRQAAELAYREELERLQETGFASAGRARLRYLPVVTREAGVSALSQRIPALLADGSLDAAAATRLDPERARVLVCGNPEMSRELRALLGERGFRTTRRGVPGQVAFEKYW